MKHARFGLILLPLLLAAGCQKPQPVVTEVNNEPGAPSIAANTYSDKWTENSIDRCRFSLTYPEMTRPNSWIQKDAPTDPVLERANREILKAYGLLSTSGTTALNPQEAGRKFIELCKSDLKDMTAQLGQESINNINYTDDATFTVHLLTPNFASLSIETYMDTGGAHGNPGLQGVTLDLATGQRMKLGDILKHDQLQPIMKLAYAEILNSYGDGLFEETHTEINAIVNDTTMMTQEDQNTKFGSSENFLLTGDGILFFWNAYEIAPYAAGQPMAFISWSQLKDKLLIKQP